MNIHPPMVDDFDAKRRRSAGRYFYQENDLIGCGRNQLTGSIPSGTPDVLPALAPLGLPTGRQRRPGRRDPARVDILPHGSAAGGYGGTCATMKIQKAGAVVVHPTGNVSATQNEETP
jgi:hypothetical protein